MTMKKTITLIFAVMVVLSLVSCGNTTSVGNDVENYDSIEASSNVTDSKTDFSETVFSSEIPPSSSDEIISSNEVYESSASVMVWIPETGTKYHSESGCSGMKKPTQVTKERAIGLGYDPCSRCH